MYTIHELSEKSGISRTALLYYESIGLLVSDGRSNSNYRLYTDESIKRLERICIYRDAGVPLKEICHILSHDENAERIILEKTLLKLNQRAREIKENQAKISKMLYGQNEAASGSFGFELETVASSLASLGIGNNIFLQFHEILEANSPESHLAVLNMLGFNENEIKLIKSRLHKKGNE